MPLESFFVGPAKSVREHELIRELRIPLPTGNLRGGFYKIGRTAEDISMVNAATTLIIQDGKISTARLVLGAVAPVPLQYSTGRGALIDQAATEETISSCGGDCARRGASHQRPACSR